MIWQLWFRKKPLTSICLANIMRLYLRFIHFLLFESLKKNKILLIKLNNAWFLGRSIPLFTIFGWLLNVYKNLFQNSEPKAIFHEKEKNIHSRWIHLAYRGNSVYGIRCRHILCRWISSFFATNSSACNSSWNRNVYELRSLKCIQLYFECMTRAVSGFNVAMASDNTAMWMYEVCDAGSAPIRSFLVRQRAHSPSQLRFSLPFTKERH